MANTKDIYQKQKEAGILSGKLDSIKRYYAYQESKDLIYNILGISESTWKRLKKKYADIKFVIQEAKKLHEHLLLVSLTRRATGEYYEDVQTIIEEHDGKTKKKIVKFKKYLPADVGANKYLLSRLHGEKYNENKEMLEIARKRQENNTEVWSTNEDTNNETE